MTDQRGQTDDPRAEPAPSSAPPGCSRPSRPGRLPLARLALMAVTLLGGNAVAGPSEPTGALTTQDAARLEQAAQMIVRVTLIGRNCAPFYAVDQTQLQEIGAGLFAQALARYGKDRLLRAVDTAEAEDTAQIRQSGAAFWCPLQRAYLNSLRMPGLIGKQQR
jgi:hypothetical protein